jgi:2-alkyl-3-oxoalkanoate reductase
MTASGLKQLRIAIVGAGYVARHHLSALKRLDFVEIVGIADLDLAAARKLAAEFGVPSAVTSLAELADRQPNTVYVLTPPASHCALALQAIDMGCHVLVEKPMADSVAECDAMIARARERGVVLSVNHSDRLDPVVLQALALVRAGVAGDVLAVDFLRSSEYPPYAGGPLPAAVRQGSYPFRDLGVHGL